MDWRLADAKNRLSEVVNLALSEGPQRISRRRDRVILLSERDYNRLAGKRRGLKDYLLHGPSFEGLDLARDKGPPRDVKL